MNRLFTLALFLTQLSLSAQITWISDCSDKAFCLDPGSCDEGTVFMREQAVTACLNSPLVYYSYRLDLFADNTIDMEASVDSVLAVLPAGTHRITWRATDNCGNASQCTYLFTIDDCLPPTLICINNLSQNLDFFCNASLHVSDVVLNAFDNCTPKDDLVFGIRRLGDGTGFPADSAINFDGCDVGAHQLQVWVKDENDFTSICLSNVTVQDNADTCACATDVRIGLQGCASSAGGAKMSNYNIRGDLSSAALPSPQSIQKNVADSCFSVAFNPVPFNNNYQVVVRANRNDDPLNGVTTFDLLQTSRHILNIEPFYSAYQRIAADVNASNTVTTFDIVETRRLILGIYDTFPAVPSWRLIRPVDDPSDILSVPKDTYRIVLTNLADDITVSGLRFVGIKMGDTNLSAAFGNDETDTRSPLLLNIENQFLEAGATVTVPIYLLGGHKLHGWQMALSAVPLFAEIVDVEGLPDEHFSSRGDEVRALWFDVEERLFPPDEALCFLKIKALQSGSLAEMLRLSPHFVSEAYMPASQGATERHPLVLGFGAQQMNGALFFPPQPNPFSHTTTFNLFTPHPTELRLELFDESGKMILEKSTQVEGGAQSLSLQASDWQGKGVFFFRLRANGEVFTGRIVKM
ncbi:MAG: T9SS type A sorting domain-containing protein [Saprospiraceae bacterium]|nr:T9SS type A sorting domain-containing protein [Saprospiraceae bacterium]